MKSASLTLALIVSMISAQEFPPLTVTYPNDCSAGQTCSDAQCCNFADNSGNQLKRCMTSAQTNGATTGQVTDDQYSVFTWTCPNATSASYLVLSIASMLAVAMSM